MWTLLVCLPVIAFLAFRLSETARRLSDAEAALSEAGRKDAALQRELVGLRRSNVGLREQEQFLVHFLKEFQRLTKSLHSGATERQIPGVLVRLVMQTLAPRVAIVFLRRMKAESDPARETRLVAAARHGDSPISLGTEIIMGQGELGFAAESQRVMSRRDFEAETALRRHRFSQENPAGLAVDLVAPMVCGEDTLGLIALSGCARASEEAKAVLGLIAQTGAQAIQNTTAYTQMKTTADLDGLTKVFNKRHMTQALAERLFEAQQNLSRLSIFLMDVDHFKNYNDVNGHVAGDKLLQLLAQLIQENVRKNDIFGRFGGEEFLLILPGASQPQALAVAHKIRAAIAAHAFPFAERQPLGLVSISGGVAEFPDDALDSNRLLQAADEALYSGKRAGRNRVMAAVRRYLGDGEPAAGVGPETAPLEDP